MRRSIRWVLALGVITAPITIPLTLIGAHIWDGATRYDRGHPDYKYVTSQFKAGSKSASIDLRVINQGDWQVICVIGGYNDPVVILDEGAAARGITFQKIDPVPTQVLGIAPVEENEGAISFIDGAGRGRTILINGFERLARQHAYACHGKGTGEITLPVSGRNT